jgi:transcription-repair coupling factor (superfamily II helicase)
MANCESSDQLDDMHQELVDRFGLFPDPVRTLLECHRLRIAARPLGILRIDATAENILVQFVTSPKVDAVKIIELIQHNSEYKLSGPDRLRIQVQIEGIAERVVRIKSLIDELSGSKTH